MAKIIGLTGGIATGKSTVSNMFLDEDIPVIDTDEIAKNLFAKDSETYQEVLDAFGEEILTPSEEINRNKLAKIIFNNKEAREKLNKIVHPKVKERVFTEVKRFELEGQSLIVVDVPLLFESSFDEFMDFTILVYAKRENQIDRLKMRDNIDDSYALKKIKSQMPMTEKKKKADFVIDNSHSILSTKKRFKKCLDKIKEAE